jgi:type IV pilus assembly protein PilM
MASELNKNIFGLDISDGALRLIHFKKRGKKIILSSYNDLAVSAGIITNGEIKQEEKLVQSIQQLIKTAKGRKIKAKNIITVLPESKTFIKVITVPFAEEKELSDSIKEEVKNHIPLSLEEIYLDWQILKKTQDSIKLLIGAAPKTIVDHYSAVLEKSGLTPYVFEIEAAAIIRSLIAKDDKKTRVIIDFGAARTGLIIYDKQTIQFTVSLPVSGNKITETIAKTLKLDLKKAEKSKVVCGLDPQKCDGALLKILLKPIENLARQINKSITFYNSNFSKPNSVAEVILCGGGANFSKIDKVLSEKLNLPVKIGNPFTKAIQVKKLSIPKNKALSYTTAVGLALRAFQKKDLI